MTKLVEASLFIDIGMLFGGIILALIGLGMLISPPTFLRYWSQLSRIYGWTPPQYEWTPGQYPGWRFAGLIMAAGGGMFLVVSVSRLFGVLREWFN